MIIRLRIIFIKCKLRLYICCLSWEVFNPVCACLFSYVCKSARHLPTWHFVSYLHPRGAAPPSEWNCMQPNNLPSVLSALLFPLLVHSFWTVWTCNFVIIYYSRHITILVLQIKFILIKQDTIFRDQFEFMIKINRVSRVFICKFTMMKEIACPFSERSWKSNKTHIHIEYVNYEAIEISVEIEIHAMAAH